MWLINHLQSLRGDPTDEFSAALRAAIRCIRNPKKYLQKVRDIITLEKKKSETRN